MKPCSLRSASALGCAQPGLQNGGAGDRVEREQTVQSAQVQRDEAALRLGGQSADDGGPASERHGGHAVFGADSQQGEYLVVAARQCDGRRDVVDLAGPDAQQVGGGLAPGVPDACLRIGAQMRGVPQAVDERLTGLVGEGGFGERGCCRCAWVRSPWA